MEMMEHSPLSPVHLPRKQELLLAASYHHRRQWGQGQLLLGNRAAHPRLILPHPTDRRMGKGTVKMGSLSEIGKQT